MAREFSVTNAESLLAQVWKLLIRHLSRLEAPYPSELFWERPRVHRNWPDTLTTLTARCNLSATRKTDRNCSKMKSDPSTCFFILRHKISCKSHCFKKVDSNCANLLKQKRHAYEKYSPLFVRNYLEIVNKSSVFFNIDCTDFFI